MTDYQTFCIRYDYDPTTPHALAAYNEYQRQLGILHGAAEREDEPLTEWVAVAGNPDVGQTITKTPEQREDFEDGGGFQHRRDDLGICTGRIVEIGAHWSEPGRSGYWCRVEYGAEQTGDTATSAVRVRVDGPGAAINAIREELDQWCLRDPDMGNRACYVERSDTTAVDCEDEYLAVRLLQEVVFPAVERATSGATSEAMRFGLRHREPVEIVRQGKRAGIADQRLDHTLLTFCDGSMIRVREDGTWSVVWRDPAKPVDVERVSPETRDTIQPPPVWGY